MMLIVMDDTSRESRAMWQRYKANSTEARVILLSDYSGDAGLIPEAFVAFKMAQPKALSMSMTDININFQSVLVHGNTGIEIWRLDRKLVSFEGDWRKQRLDNYSCFGATGKVNEVVVLGEKGMHLRRTVYDNQSRMLMVETQLVDSSWVRIQYSYSDDDTVASESYYTIDGVMFSSEQLWYQEILRRVSIYYNLHSDDGSIVSLCRHIELGC